MDSEHIGAGNPRQALALALMDAICAPRDGSKRAGSFLTITSETAILEPLCGLIGSGLRDRQGALIAAYPTAESDNCDGLVLVRRVGDLMYAQAAEPYWPIAQRRMSLVVRDGGMLRAFRVDDDDELREVPSPVLAGLATGVADTWRRIAETATSDVIAASNWDLASLSAL